MRRVPQYYFQFEKNPEPAPVKVEIRETKSYTSREQELQELLRDMESSVDLDFKDLRNTVFADGDCNSPIMMVGEGPGEHEVIQKRPFVGRSGQLLNIMLESAGILRERIYTTNVVIWRPPGNRTPMPKEIDIMRPYLLRHINIIKPKLLLLVGGIAYKCAMDEIIAISKIRGEWRSRDFCPKIMCIFHPSYLLRSPTHRKEVWFDILNFRKGICDSGFAGLLEKGVLNL